VFPDLPPNQAAALEAHYKLLLKWNKTLNLTRIEAMDEAVERHYRESLFLSSHLTDGSVADIGSGAGFPGFVVAVARPQCSVTLIESHQRKAVFLKEASRHMRNIRVVAKRASEVHEHFDWIVSRAVSYVDLGTPVAGLGSRVALLSGAEKPPKEWDLDWEVFPLPSGSQRFLRVSRETKSFCFT
jgi:16S rRNA G527 N7-methylase RsmG